MAVLFANRDDAKAVLKLARKKPRRQLQYNDGPFVSEGFMLKTPSGGIPGRTGTTCGFADCTCQLIDFETGEITDMLDQDGDPQVVKVFHIGTSPVGGDRYIQAKRIFGVLVADMEDCS